MVVDFSRSATSAETVEWRHQRYSSTFAVSYLLTRGQGQARICPAPRTTDRYTVLLLAHFYPSDLVSLSLAEVLAFLCIGDGALQTSAER